MKIPSKIGIPKILLNPSTATSGSGIPKKVPFSKTSPKQSTAKMNFWKFPTNFGIPEKVKNSQKLIWRDFCFGKVSKIPSNFGIPKITSQPYPTLFRPTPTPPTPTPTLWTSLRENQTRKTFPTSFAVLRPIDATFDCHHEFA